MVVWRGYLKLILLLLIYGMALAQAPGPAQDKESGEAKALAAIQRAIDALGGKTFLQVRDIKSNGRYYQFRKGANTPGVVFQDSTRLPNKSRYEEGTKKKEKDITVFNLDIDKGWMLEGRKGVRDAKPEEVAQFKKTVKHAIENVLRTRYRERGVKLFYFGPEEVAGKIRAEVVEILDQENDSVLVYFDLKTHLPVKLEYTETAADGRKLKIEEEYTNWHNIEGVRTPMRIDVFTNGDQSSQRFVEKLSYSSTFTDSLFEKPQPEK
ncbi:MAG: hypothetical protein HYR55_18210 [Acidobacteria bacterium]|nr:hypothetical protein [Acidobacteriota bacterium]